MGVDQAWHILVIDLTKKNAVLYISDMSRVTAGTDNNYYTIIIILLFHHWFLSQNVSLRE